MKQIATGRPNRRFSRCVKPSRNEMIASLSAAGWVAPTSGAGRARDLHSHLRRGPDSDRSVGLHNVDLAPAIQYDDIVRVVGTVVDTPGMPTKNRQ
jgi:hypothetical protein